MRFDFSTGTFVGEDDPDRVALIGTDRTLTWRELRSEVDRLAVEITNSRGSEGPVLIHGHKEAGMVTAILACLRARVPYVPVDTFVPAARVATIAKVAAVDFVLAPGPARVADHLNLAVPDLSRSGARTRAASAWTGVGDLAYVIFTSGSTGEPKGVQITRANVDDLVQWVRSEDFNFSSRDQVMSQCSFSFDVSFFELIAALANGGTLVLSSPTALKMAKPYAGLTPTVWSSTPSFLSMALTSPAFDHRGLPTLRRFYVAGEALSATLCQRLWRKFPGAELWNAYGPTEITVITTLTRITPEMLEEFPSLPIGRVKPGVLMPTAAADQTSAGELLVIGPNVSPGYLNRPDLNAARFFTAADGRRGYRTGDLGFVRDGLIFYQGRIDQQIKLHGFRIELEEIDGAASALDEIEAAATVGLRRGGEVKKLVCFLQVRAGAATDGLVERVREALAARLPYYMVPAEFRVIGAMPYNVNQKVDRGALTREIDA